MIVADTGAIIALLDARDRHHEVLRQLYAKRAQAWLLPWAILPEVDYLALRYLGAKVEQAFLADLADGVFRVDFGIVAISPAPASCALVTGLYRLVSSTPS